MQKFEASLSLSLSLFLATCAHFHTHTHTHTHIYTYARKQRQTERSTINVNVQVFTRTVGKLMVSFWVFTQRGGCVPPIRRNVLPQYSERLHVVQVGVTPESVTVKMEVIRFSETSKHIYHML